MKKIVVILMSLSVLFSCSGDDNGAAIITSINGAPGAPALVFPTDNLICTNFNLEFDWNAVTDPEGDAVSYIIDIATDANFDVVVFSALTTVTTQLFTLEKGVTYYWRVKVRDSEGNESGYSETQSFITEPDAGINTIPYPPTAVTPQDGAVISGNTVSLEWTATDADGDALTYDVYFGDTNPPILVSENQENSTLELSLSANTAYYWRLVVKDENGGAVIGQVWNFTTE